MEEILRKVERFVEEKKLVNENDRILIAVSGGPDSIFLFHFFIYLSKKKNIEIKVSYIHHHLRKEADKELQFVKEISEKYNIDFIRGDIEIKEKRNIESRLREKRYEKLYQICEREKCNKIAVGHTLDDHIETVLMNFFRGSGLSGICGIRPEIKLFPRSEVSIIRPLLCVEKEEIKKYLKKNKIPYMIDRSNLSLNFYRNKIRKKIIPFLIKFRPSLKKQIFKMTSILQQEEEFLRNYAEEKFNEVCSEDEEKIKVDIDKFKSLEMFLKRRIGGIIYRKVKNTPYVSYSEIEKIVKMIEKGKNEFKKGNFFLKEEEKRSFSFILNIPGKTLILDNILIKAEFVEFSEEIFKNRDKFTGYFDYEKIKGDIIVRNRKIGDKFIPLGLKKEKKISRFFIDKKIPKTKRDEILIFENNGKIMWVCGLEISEEFKVERNTKKILKISAEKYL